MASTHLSRENITVIRELLETKIANTTDETERIAYQDALDALPEVG